MLAVYIYSRLTRRIERFSTVTGKAYRPRVMKIGSFRYVAAALVWMYLAIVVIAPFFVMLWASVQPFYAVPSAQSLEPHHLRRLQVRLHRPRGADRAAQHASC